MSSISRKISGKVRKFYPEIAVATLFMLIFIIGTMGFVIFIAIVFVVVMIVVVAMVIVIVKNTREGEMGVDGSTVPC